MNWIVVLLAVLAIFLFVYRVRPGPMSQTQQSCDQWNMQYPCHLNSPDFQEPRSSYWEFQQPRLNYKYF